MVEGRDIASVVAPDADLKVYLTASAAARAQRRSAEDATEWPRRGPISSAGTGSTRAGPPTRCAGADDAIEVDTTGMGIDEVVARLLDMLNSKVSRDRRAHRRLGIRGR